MALGILSKRIQLRDVPQGHADWDTDTGTLWDTGEVALNTDESTNLRVKQLYRGQALPAGNYTYRVQVQDSLGAWSAWSYATLTLTQPYQPDLGAIDYLSTYRQQSPVRIVIYAMGTQRGPGGGVKAIIYDAAHIGASKVANDVGEFYFTIPTMHPQAQEIEPLQRHYSLQFYRRGIWTPLFEGVIVDMDATEDEVVFYGIDYLGLLSKSVETAFFTEDFPEKHIEDGGSKYLDKTISFVIKDQLHRAKDPDLSPDSPLGFINVEPQNESTLMEAITSKVTINVAFRERLALILGLIQSAKQGTGNRSRLWPERLADGTYQWRFRNNAGTTRDNLRLSYGELVQGFRIVVLGQWAATVYGVGRITNEIKPRFKKANAVGIDTDIWGSLTVPAVWNDLMDENDLQRRVKQLAREMGKFGKSVALGLRVSGIEVFDGWDLLDSIPVHIQRGAVDTTRYGSGYWTIQGVEYRLEPDGHDELTLAIKPREDTTPPDDDLIPSRPVSGAGEWGQQGQVGTNLVATSTTMVRDDGTIAAVINATWDAIPDSNFDLFVIQLEHLNEDVTPDFHDAVNATTFNPEIEFEDQLPGEDYAIRVGAYDTNGNFSGYGPYVVVGAAIDTTPPSVPGGIVVTPGILSLLITWLPVPETDFSHYEVNSKLSTIVDWPPVIAAHATAIALTGLQASNATDTPPHISYDIRVRSVDTSGNRSAWSATLVGFPAKVQGTDIEADSITANEIATGSLSADDITTGTMRIGGSGHVPLIQVFGADDVLIGQVDEYGMVWKDPSNTDRVMRFLDGVLEFSDDYGVDGSMATWRTAIGPDGIIADSILVGRMPGGQNLMPNSSFEVADFSSDTSYQWTDAAHWGTTVGTDVNIDKSTGTLNLTVIT